MVVLQQSGNKLQILCITELLNMNTFSSARDTIKKYGTGYYRATFLFPKHIQKVVWTLYQFVRLPDEIVDTQIEGAEENLSVWENTWKDEVYNKKRSPNTVVHDFVSVMYTYNIPPEYVEAFFAAMRQDITKDRYETYVDLEGYMYGSATVIGYMMSHIIGHTEGALPYARALGEAFQMTNFLRDIKEDYDERGRIYIPIEDMKKFGVTESHISQGIADDAWKALMRYEVERTRLLYETGVSGITYLNPEGRKAVYAAALIYKEILDMIEENEFSIFKERITVSPFRKTVLLCKALWYKNQ